MAPPERPWSPPAPPAQLAARATGAGIVRRLVVNADDFGLSPAVNEAVRRAHRDGILTCASLMVNAPAAAQAVELARAHPRLGVGLHLVLVCGRAALGHDRIPGLTAPDGHFRDDPVRTGWRYFARPALRPQIAAEIDAQLDRFRQTGLTLDHVNGHLNLHLHPVVLRLLLSRAAHHGVRSIRLTRDRFWLNARLASGAWLYRATHALVFNALCAWARPRLRAARLRHTRWVFGLLQNARVDTAFLAGLLDRLPEGDSELYSHPSLDEFPHEWRALMDPGVRAAATRHGIHLIRYQDL